MKKNEKALIKENTQLTATVFKMVLEMDTLWIKNPGQFINITLDGFYLKRPISVCDWDETTLTIIYKVVGKGTKQMSKMKPQDHLECLVDLGNGFDVVNTSDEVVILGGGVGVPPMFGVTKACLAQGKKVSVILGFASKEEAFYIDEFKALNVPIFVCTNDGSLGTKGFVTDVIAKENLTQAFYLACGPMPMLKSIAKTSKAQGLLSFEERMGCGFGACMGCSCKTLTGYKRICVEGPVMKSEEIIWPD